MTATPRALVVDADADAGAELAELLAESGLSCERAGSVEEALSILEQRAFQLLTLDLARGVGALAPTIEKLSTDFPDTGLVVVSAAEGDAADALVHGALDVLAKPFSPDEVSHVARKALDVVSRTSSRL